MIKVLHFSDEETFNSNALSVPTSMLKDMYHAFPSNLSQILEEEERQSSRNSVEKEHEKREEADVATTIVEGVEDHDQVDKSDVEHDPEKCAKDDNDNNNNEQEDNLERDKDDDESVAKSDSSDEKTSSKRKISRT